MSPFTAHHRRWPRPGLFFPCALLGLLFVGSVGADSRLVDGRLPQEGPVLYRSVPDVTLTDIAGSTFRLRERWRQRPVLVTLVFERCHQICPFYLRSLAQAVSAVGGVGEDYDVLVVSFDPQDDVHALRGLAQRHGLDNASGWVFAVASPAEAGALAAAIGFWIDPGPSGAQFDHPAMLAAIDRGTVVRLLIGATVHERRLREVVWELNRGLVPTYPLPSEKIWFRCLDYDVERGRVALDWGLLLLLLPGATMFLSAALIFRPGRAQSAAVGHSR